MSRCSRHIKNHRLMHLGRGRFGFAPPRVRPKDGLYSLHGCVEKTLLRPQSGPDSTFRFVGVCGYNGFDMYTGVRSVWASSGFKMARDC